MSIRIKNHLKALSEVYGKNLSDTTAIIFLNLLSKFSEDEVINALNLCMSELKYFPTISDIVNRISPPVNEDSEAREAAARICEAIAKYGWTQPEKARLHVGEIGWYVVEREGGWQRICENTFSDNLPILKSQWRELAKSAILRNKQGLLNQAPSFEKLNDKNKNYLDAIPYSSNIIKSL